MTVITTYNLPHLMTFVEGASACPTFFVEQRVNYCVTMTFALQQYLPVTHPSVPKLAHSLRISFIFLSFVFVLGYIFVCLDDHVLIKRANFTFVQHTVLSWFVLVQSIRTSDIIQKHWRHDASTMLLSRKRFQLPRHTLLVTFSNPKTTCVPGISHHSVPSPSPILAPQRSLSPTVCLQLSASFHRIMTTWFFVDSLVLPLRFRHICSQIVATINQPFLLFSLCHSSFISLNLFIYL
ncbi:hypothetical protein DFJ58DRAFT_757323 [Suillus subalutaceus]|uniref:uncharacterized protein n=1 Tax=Suillus subalutaceus TaxID=48586 RepID=UPI001B8781C2|nr:uncharacterized protein DFJ58DRAFT_757323 [Suillus subalutaceus]KAG1874484.1 hypothetical protein DFJ58DRAFT_757323 [Suillus subalutaceus]